MGNAIKLDNLEKINYTNLNHKQKETYNFQKVSSIFADYGFATIQLNDDWQSADFLAQHIDGETYLKVQLKSRLTFHEKYLNKDIYICFPHKKDWYLFPHDELLKIFLEKNGGGMAISRSWSKAGSYSFSSLSKQNKLLLKKYKL